MNVVLWVVQGLLALAFLMAGGMKLAKSKEDLGADPRMGWTHDFSANSIKLIGLAEVLGAIGLVLPAALDVAPILTPVAAVGLALMMLGAAVVHLRRKEPQALVPVVVLGALAVFVAYGRFGPETL